MAFVSLIGFAFLYELSLIQESWFVMAVPGWILPEIPSGSLLVIMSVLGAVPDPQRFCWVC